MSEIYGRACRSGKRSKRSDTDAVFDFFLNVYGQSSSNDTVDISGEVETPVIVEKPGDRSGLSTGAIVGIVIGCIAFVAILIGVGVFVFLYMRRKGQRETDEPNEPILNDSYAPPYAGALHDSLNAYGISIGGQDRKATPPNAYEFIDSKALASSSVAQPKPRTEIAGGYGLYERIGGTSEPPAGTSQLPQYSSTNNQASSTQASTLIPRVTPQSNDGVYDLVRF
ncbi:unnamed protein product [Toxocara canis]|uniref:Transmembrane protein n=1 Tax=Toxocara canis TaxID=6265 RepID=A0A183UM18_TOXCA|nr:unnamed protein product [Toxocara canis]